MSLLWIDNKVVAKQWLNQKPNYVIDMNKIFLKKLVAREFLFPLLGAIIFISGSFFCEWKSNKYESDKSDKNSEISKLKYYADIVPKRIKLYYICQQEWEYPFKRFLEPEYFLEKSQSDENFQRELLRIINENQTGPPMEFEGLREILQSDLESENYLSTIRKKESELEDVRSSFWCCGYSEQGMMSFLIIIGIVLFGIRYLYYMTAWSVSQLRQ